MDQKVIELHTNKTVVRHVAGQVGSVSAAPIGPGSVLLSNVGSGVCPCYFFDFVCYLTKWNECLATVLIIIGIIAAVVLLLICGCIACKALGIKNCCKVIDWYTHIQSRNKIISLALIKINPAKKNLTLLSSRMHANSSSHTLKVTVSMHKKKNLSTTVPSWFYVAAAVLPL